MEEIGEVRNSRVLRAGLGQPRPHAQAQSPHSFPVASATTVTVHADTLMKRREAFFYEKSPSQLAPEEATCSHSPAGR